jgi:hypothetical protein
MKTLDDSLIFAAVEILKLDSVKPSLKEQAHEYLKLVLRKAHDEEAAIKIAR